MSSLTEPTTWKLRLVGAAAGAIGSAVVGTALAWTFIGFYVGVVGLVAGAVTGAVYAPRLMATPPQAGRAGAAGFASVVGVVAHTAFLGVMFLLAAGGWGDATRFVGSSVTFEGFLMVALLCAMVGLLFGWPMAFAAAVVATWFVRQATNEVGWLWMPAGLLLFLPVLGVTAYVVPNVLRG